MYRHSNSSKGRVKYDYYSTPPEATRALLIKESFKGSILEPCCGSNSILNELKKRYPKKHITGFDLNPKTPQIRKMNFFDFNRNIDNIITNPPYNQAQEFIEHSLKITKHKVAMLLQLGFLESKGRYPLFKNHPPKVIYVFSNRISCHDEGTKRMAFAWFIWDKQYKGPTMVDWINTEIMEV